ncbi:MAG: SDR family oxidoreductase [Bacteroidota bacterium]
MTNLFDLKNKKILITGGTGVLGTAWSRYLAQEGARIIILGINQAEGDALVQQIKSERGYASFYICDVTKESSLAKVATEVSQSHQHIDVLINAAGGNKKGATITPDQSIFDSDLDALKAILDLNYIGTYLAIKTFLPLFKDKKGSIINISSMSAARPLTRVMGYSSAKAAIDNLTQWLAVEFAQKYGEGLRVNALAPGFFLTTQNRELLTQADGSYTERGEQIIANTPMGRFGTPEELLGAMHYLCSEASKFVTGTIMAIDGGFGAYSGV